MTAYADGAIAQHFRDDLLVSMLRSNSVRGFVSRQKDRLVARDGELLTRVIHLLRVACKKMPGWLEGHYVPTSTLLEPDGQGWPAVLEIVADELDHLTPIHVGLLVGLLEDWSRGASASRPTPDGTASAGDIAFGLLDFLGGRRVNDQRKRILQVIAKIPRCESSRFAELVGKASIRANQRETVYQDLAEILLGGG